MEKVILNVEGMSCSHCVAAVTKAVSALEGVANVEVSLENKTATVEYEAPATVDAMKAAIEDQGYDVV
ncbi:heavy-metal-associated domain-containing protein [Alkalibacter rhizosphaerae]|uniref:Heavy-metal-associated domain-containing protein n=1 Tax=Alkalibacter rhizosphaerae TaxID=2815577 RepID=A0A974XDZ9_9FIRM|nr:copper ion binding protein [Alkalibacter rhizosphaerae]QSX08083.1 heavy-metal-associated domain-containing protein [Alkalibacter rhizosphaerae]